MTGTSPSREPERLPEPEQYRGCTTPHEHEPIYCHVCEADFMAWLRAHPEWEKSLR